MEPAGNYNYIHHHHQLQDQFVGSSSSSLATLSCYGIGSTPHSDLTSNYMSFLNIHGFMNPYPSETPLNQREQQEKAPHVSSQLYSSCMADNHHQNLGSIWDASSGVFLNNHHFKQDLHLSRVKHEQFINGNFIMNKMELFPENSSSRNDGRGRGFPSLVNVSYLNQGYPADSLDNINDSHALNLLTSSRFSADSNPYSEDRFELSRDDILHCGNVVDHMQQTHHPPLNCSNKKVSASSNGLSESKRTSGKMEPKAIQTATKKSRLGGSVSSPPFKVRKEKLGDRIAALQQLVAPFGKTDTASVLMEAIGYIKFLQNQVETLSVPYMKASRNKTSRGVLKGGCAENEHEEPKRDLKSRGLCLVPLPCLSYITGDGDGGAVWPPPPHFGGAT